MLASAMALAPRAWAHTDWPSSRLTLLLAYPPGGITDRLAHDLSERLRRGLGLTVVIEHRPGAGGTLAMEQLARAPAGVERRHATDLGALLRHGALRPGPRCGPAAGAGWHAADGGRHAHAAGARLGRHDRTGPHPAGLDSAAALIHVPYKGGGQQLQDALAGQFEVLSTNFAADQLRWVRQGRLKALAVGAARRQDGLPTVPTLAELGHPAANRWSTFGLFAPGAMPTALRTRLQRQIDPVLDADWQGFVRGQYSEPAFLEGEAVWSPPMS